MTAGVCHFCEAPREIRDEHLHECPATTIARLSAASKTAAAQRNSEELQERAQTARALEEQVDDLHADFDF